VDIATCRHGVVVILLSVLITAVTGACGQDPVAKAEEDYRVLEKTGGDVAEMCAAARAIQRAAVREGSTEDAEYWGPMADSKCLIAKIEGPHI
jgi:hypothetical protein